MVLFAVATVSGYSFAPSVGGWLFAAVLLVVLFGTVFAAVHHAEMIAERIGEPFGTLLLTMAITIIEVALIATIMYQTNLELSTMRTGLALKNQSIAAEISRFSAVPASPVSHAGRGRSLGSVHGLWRTGTRRPRVALTAGWRPLPEAASGDDVGGDLVFDEGDAVAQQELALLQPLQAQQIRRGRLMQRVDRRVEVAVLLLQPGKLGLEFALILVGHGVY